MQRHHSAGRRLPLLAAFPLAISLTLGGCLDGPFARVNPHDAETQLELSIAGGKDTLRVAGEQVLFQLVTKPVTSGYTVRWTSSTTSLLDPLGNGVYVVNALPGFPSTVEIRAQMGAHFVTRNIVLLPAAP